ncbi:MAG: mechanosensitive ion channel protein MscS [Firmicutes bacterium ML8_F2]|jgi:small conductance mechanosensitive channel|nr:MAG: mechanosensitive ion channel protein MscS [Firmicutes bacterium ML8_F2]
MDLEFVYEALLLYGSKVILAIIALLAGLKVIGWISKLVERRLKKTDTDRTLQPFLVTLVKVFLQILLVISIVSMLGVQMTSFIAVLGAMAFAVGLALQGSLANFAGGVLILLLKPFRVGDYIEAAGYSGTVKEIQIFYTMLDTPDNKRIIIPNATLSNNSTINYNINPLRRIDFSIGVGYEDDIDKVKSLLLEIADKHPLVLDDPPPQVVMGEHGDSAVVYYFRMWSKREDYWTIYFALLEEIKRVFDREGINIPYLQTEVHLLDRD